MFFICGSLQSQQPGYAQLRPQQPPADGELVGRGRLRGPVGATAKSQGEGRAKDRACACVCVSVCERERRGTVTSVQAKYKRTV